MSGELAACINRDLLSADRINANLPRKEQQVLVPQEKVENVRVFQKEAPFLRNQNWIRSQIELLLIDIRIGKISIHSAHRDQIAGQSIFHINPTGVQRAP